MIRTFTVAFRFLLCVIDIYSKYAWVVPLKDKKELQLLLLFKTQTNQNTNQIKSEETKAVNFTIDQWNHDLKNDTEIYATHNDRKSVMTERFVTTLKFQKMCILI